VSPFRPFFLPQPRVYLRNDLLLPSSAPRSANISPVLSSLRILPVVTGVYPSNVPDFQMFRPFDIQTLRQSQLSSFPAAHPRNRPVTPFPATHTKSPSCKSFACHTSEKEGGGARLRLTSAGEVSVHLLFRLGAIASLGDEEPTYRTRMPSIAGGGFA